MALRDEWVTDEHLELIWATLRYLRASMDRRAGSVNEGVRLADGRMRLFHSALYTPLELARFPQLDETTCKRSKAAAKVLAETETRREWSGGITGRGGVIRGVEAVPDGALMRIMDALTGDAEETRRAIMRFVWTVMITGEERARFVVPIDGFPGMPRGWTSKDGPLARFHKVGIEIE